MQTERVIKEYDPVILGKIRPFAAPHKKWITFGIIALIITTAAELLNPIVIQKTIDFDVLPHYGLYDQKTAKPDKGTPIVIGNSIFYDRKDDKAVKGNWFVVPIDKSISDLIKAKPGLFLSDGVHAALKNDDYKKLNGQEKSILRKEDLDSIGRNSLIVMILLFLSTGFSFVQIYLMALTSQNIMKGIRVGLFRHLIGQSLSYLSETPVGKLVSGLTNDVATIDELFTSIFTALLKDVFLMIGIVAALFYLDVKLAGIALITLPPAFVVVEIMRRKSRHVFRRVRALVSRVNTYLSEHISGMEVVQMFVREALSHREFSDENSKLLKANLNQMYVYAFFRPMVDLLASASVAVVIYIGAGFYRTGVVSLGILIAYVNLINRFFEPVKDIAENFTTLQSAMAGGERIFSLFDVNRKITEREGAADSEMSGTIEFDNVHFSYKEDVPVLKGLSFKVEKGETIAIVGYTGAGKTTIASLLTRLWDIDSGRILVGGEDIGAMTLNRLRRTVQPVQQDVFIFAGNVRENITLGEEMAPGRFENAVKAAEVESFIGRLEEGYDTELSERGANLSVGQRQLLSFARALAHDPEILILDEATAHIDTETEDLIQRALKNLLRGRTSLVIAHRLSTIRNADRILVLNDGVVAEMGTHDQLLEKGGIYKSLYELQFQREIEV